MHWIVPQMRLYLYLIVQSASVLHRLTEYYRNKATNCVL
jgi:hypothetical protein